MSWRDEAPSDEALVAAIGGRSQEALGEIYRRYGAAVWSVAKLVCRRAERAEEVCQTVFTELWSRPERFDPSRGTLRSWLVAEAHRRAVTVIRSDQRGTDGAGEPARELAKEARQALDQLTTVERDAILLAYLDGQTWGETARRLAVAEGTVKSRIRGGLLNLRRAMEAEGVTT